METNELYTLAEIEVAFKHKCERGQLPKIRTSDDVYMLFMRAWDHNKIDLLEQVNVMFLDNSLQCLGIFRASSGGTSNTVVDPKIIFSTALKAKAAKLILSHNHPSGHLTPSRQDIALSQKLVDGGKFLDIEILDHFIVNSDWYYSMVENGTMPSPSF